MRAEINQDGLDFGYARVVIWLDKDDQPYVKGDSIAIGRPVGNNSWEYIARAGGGKKSGVPEPLKMAEEPVAEMDSVTFMLTPFYVDSMDDGNYSIDLVGRDGKVKNRVASVRVQVKGSGLDEVETLRDYNEDDVAAGKNTGAEAGTPKDVPYSEMERDLRREEANAQLGLADAELQPQAPNKKAPDKTHDSAAKPEPGTPKDVPYSEMERDLRREEANAQLGLAEAEMQPQAPRGKGWLYAGILILLLAICGGGWFYWQNQKAFEQEQIVLQPDEARK